MDPGVRLDLVEILEDSCIFYLRDEGLTESFVAGRVDPILSELDMDSLAAMELCIALEVRYGSTLVPATLMEVGTLGTLAERLVPDPR